MMIFFGFGNNKEYWCELVNLIVLDIIFNFFDDFKFILVDLGVFIVVWYSLFE